MKKLEYFFGRFSVPSITAENGIDFRGSVHDSQGDLHYLEVYFKYGPTPCAAVLIDGICFDGPVVEFINVPKKRQRVGSEVTSLQQLEVVLKPTTGVFSRFIVSHNMIQIFPIYEKEKK